MQFLDTKGIATLQQTIMVKKYINFKVRQGFYLKFLRNGLLKIILEGNLERPFLKKTFRDHLFSTFSEFSEKLTFLTPWYAFILKHIMGLEMLVFREIFRTYKMIKWMIS